jgi:hypothetical protein
MRNVQNQNNQKRMRGRNRGKNHNPLTRVFESNGPDVKIRGTASHVAEKYIQLARDAQASGDPVGAENYYQHAEHYFRLIATAQEQMRINQPQQYANQQAQMNGGNDSRDGNYDDEGDEDGTSQDVGGQPQPQFGPRDPQPYVPRDAQFYGQQNEQPRLHGGPMHNHPSEQPPANDQVDRLPSFITGGQQPAPEGELQNGASGGGERFQNDRHDRQNFRRRRRHRGGYRNDGGQHSNSTNAAGPDDDQG